MIDTQIKELSIHFDVTLHSNLQHRLFTKSRYILSFQLYGFVRGTKLI